MLISTAVDGQLAISLGVMTQLSVAMLLKFLAVVVSSPAFLFPALLVTVLGAWCAQIFLKAQLSVKRGMSTARAPVLGHFTAAIAGLSACHALNVLLSFRDLEVHTLSFPASIRAYGAQAQFRNESYSRIDRYVRAGRTFNDLNRWVAVRIDFLGALFSAALAMYLVYGSSARAANTGFSLNMAGTSYVVFSPGSAKNFLQSLSAA